MNEPKKIGRPKKEGKKEVLTIRLFPEFEAQAKATAYWARTTFNEMVEEGLRLVMDRLEKEHNNGKPFPAKPEKE